VTQCEVAQPLWHHKDLFTVPLLLTVSCDKLIAQVVVWPVYGGLKWPGPSDRRGALRVCVCGSDVHINITPLLYLRCHCCL